MTEMCPKCQGLPVRYKLVGDDTLVGLHKVAVMCRNCNGMGEVESDKDTYVLGKYCDESRFKIRLK